MLACATIAHRMAMPTTDLRDRSGREAPAVTDMELFVENRGKVSA
jgi:hypothetical protein